MGSRTRDECMWHSNRTIWIPTRSDWDNMILDQSLEWYELHSKMNLKNRRNRFIHSIDELKFKFKFNLIETNCFISVKFVPKKKCWWTRCYKKKKISFALYKAKDSDFFFLIPFGYRKKKNKMVSFYSLNQTMLHRNQKKKKTIKTKSIWLWVNTFFFRSLPFRKNKQHKLLN